MDRLFYWSYILEDFQNSKFLKRNWVFVTNSDFLIPIFFPHDGVNLWYFKLRFFHLTEFIVWNISGLRHWVAKILRLENHSLWQRLNSFLVFFKLYRTNEMFNVKIFRSMLNNVINRFIWEFISVWIFPFALKKNVFTWAAFILLNSN